MPARRILLLTQPAVIAVVALAFALAGLALLTARTVQRTRSAERQMENAERTLVAATRIKATVLEAGEAGRAFLVGRAPEDLAGFRDAQRRHPDELRALAAQLAADDRPARATEALVQLIADWMRELDTVVTAAAASATPTGNALEDQATLRELDHLRRRLAHLQNEARQVLAAASVRAANESKHRDAALLILLSGTVCATLVGTWIVLRHARAVDQMLTVCAWTHRVKWHDQWITFEEYLARRYDQRCTHGICEEAAAEIQREIAQTPVTPVEPPVPAAPAGHVPSRSPRVAL